MSEMPKVWWLPQKGNGPMVRLSSVAFQADGVWRRAALTSDSGRGLDFLPDDATPLVPQASRDELREAIERTVQWHVEMMQEPRIADRVMDLLAERGLVARPTGEKPK